MPVLGPIPRKPIRVAIVCTMNQLGGTTTHVRHIYQHLQGQGIQLTLIFCSLQEKAVRDYMLAGGCDAQDMVFISNGKKRLFFPFILELARILREGRFDIVHAFDVQSHVLSGLAARWIKGIRMICHVEGQFLATTVSWPKRMLYRTLNSLLKGYFVRSLAVSQGLADELIKGGFRPASRVEVLRLGIAPLYDGDPLGLTYPGLAAGAPVIGTLSRLSVEKGLDRLLKAAVLFLREVPAARVVICGHGPEEASLKALARDLGIEARVQFVTLPFTADIRDILRTYDIYVFPSLREGLPITLLEAMSLGRPAIAADIDGIREVITSGVDGILVDASVPEVFAREMIALCRDVPRAVEMGRRGWERVRAAFHLDREMERLAQIYRDVAA